MLRYIIRYAKLTMESGKFGETIQAFAQFGMQPIPQNYPIYKTLALEIFVECDPTEIANLRKALYNFYRLLEGTGEHRNPAGQEFYRYLTIAHIAHMKNVYQKKDMLKL